MSDTPVVPTVPTEPKRAMTPNSVLFDSEGKRTTTITVKRCCNGCARELGDATDAELDAAVDGRPLPDVREECGCG